MLLLVRRALPIALVFLATWMSHQPALPGGLSLPAPWDKVAHGSGFLALGLILFMGWADRIRPGVLLALLVLYGAGDELHQGFVPGRDGSLGDWLADTAGAGLGLLCWLGIRRLLAERTLEVP